MSRYKVCSKCGEIVYITSENKYSVCLSCKTENSVVSVDDHLMYIISILVKKGYKPKYCCESHFYNTEMRIMDFEYNISHTPTEECNINKELYISFENGVGLNDSIASLLDNCDYFYLDTDYYYGNNVRYTIRANIPQDDFITYVKAKSKALVELCEYVDSLDALVD